MLEDIIDDVIEGVIAVACGALLFGGLVAATVGFVFGLALLFGAV